MKTSGNTVLINGGSAGIGFAIAKLFSAENHVIITGRDTQRLEEARSKLTNTTAIRCDVSDAVDVENLAKKVIADFPQLNIVINNAGKGNHYDILSPDADAFHLAGEEMLTNYLSVIRLNEKFLPVLQKQEASAIINVTSIAVFGPRIQLISYGASKAALHAYTQGMRLLLENSPVRVFELFPPLVNTEFTKDFGGEKGMSPEVVAAEFFKAFAEDQFEVYIGWAAELHDQFFSDNTKGFLALNGR